MGCARPEPARLAPRGPRGPVRERLRLPGGPGPRRRPRGDLSRRPRRAGHPGPARAGAPGRRRPPLRQALTQAGAYGMSLNGLAHTYPEPGLIGEVVEASTTELLAQAIALD